MVEWFDRMAQSLGHWGVLLLGLAALLEYLLPPVPGDTVVLLGGVYVARGKQPWLLVLAAVTLGSVLGAATNWLVGRAVARRFERNPQARPLLGLTPARLAGVQRRMERWGAWLLVFNRFIPAVRALVFVAAGAARLPLGRTLALGAVSALMHGGLVLGAGMAVGGNLERLQALMSSWQRALLVLGGIALLGLAVRAWVARRHAPPPPPAA